MALFSGLTHAVSIRCHDATRDETRRDEGEEDGRDRRPPPRLSSGPGARRPVGKAAHSHFITVIIVQIGSWVRHPLAKRLF